MSRIAGISLALGAWLLVLPSEGLAILNVFNISSYYSAQSPTEKKLIALAEKIAGEQQQANLDRADRDVQKHYLKGRSLWAKSPVNRPGLSADLGRDSRYEAGILVQAVVSYYEATNRPAMSIPYLIEARDETRRLRSYSDWYNICLALAELYRRLGMLERMNLQVGEVLTFYKRLGMTPSALTGELGRDSVEFLKLISLHLEQDPEAYSGEELELLYSGFLRSSKEATVHWSWSPDRGFDFVRYFPVFIKALIASGASVARIEKAIEDMREANRWNRRTDPLLHAGEKDTSFFEAALGRSLFTEFNIRTSEYIDWEEGLFTWSKTPPEKIRFLNSSHFDEAYALAEIYMLAGDANRALEWSENANAMMSQLEKDYEQFGSAFFALDRIPRKANLLHLWAAQAFEALGQFDESHSRYRKFLAWTESVRNSLPIDERLHFFQGTGLPGYLGSIRNAAHWYKDEPTNEALHRLLVASERIRSRQLLEMLGVSEEQASLPEIEAYHRRIRPDQVVVMFQDLRNVLLTIVITDQRELVQLVQKPEGWDESIFRLRNELANKQKFDSAAAKKIGDTLLGFAVNEIESRDELFVITDGAISALPPALLSISDSKLLGDDRKVTLVPSLALFAESHSAEDQRQTAERLLVVADPQYQSGERISLLDSRLLATRGAATLNYFTPLPETRLEAESIMTSFAGDSRGLIGAQALESQVKKLPLSTFSHLHFATHGVIGNDIPGIKEPALVLGHEEAEDGFLTATEVAGLDLNAELTVLSACNTGNGEYFNGEGLMGLGRAFMIAGSNKVIVSLWPVESISAQKMMELLYYNLRQGLTIDDALLNAQRALRRMSVDSVGAGRGVLIDAKDFELDRVYNNPFYWAPFVLISAR